MRVILAIDQGTTGTTCLVFEDVSSSWRERARYEPAMSSDERETLVAQWRRAFGRATEWVEA